MVVFLWWCFCGGVLVVVFLCWCGGVFVFCGVVFVVVFLWCCKMCAGFRSPPLSGLCLCKLRMSEYFLR